MEEFSISKGYKKNERVFSEVRKIISDYDKEKIDIPGINWSGEEMLKDNDVIFLRKYHFHGEDDEFTFEYKWRIEHTQTYLVLLSMNGAINITYLFSRVVKYKIAKFLQLEHEWLLNVKRRFLKPEYNQDAAKQFLLDYFRGLKKESELYRTDMPEIGMLSLFFYNHDFYALDEKSLGFIEQEIQKLNEYFSGYTTNINSHKHTTTSRESKNIQHETPESPTKDIFDNAGDDLAIYPKRGTLSFQYNAAIELGIIELIQNRYKEVNGEQIGPKEIGEILSDLFLYGKPKQWSKVHGQYKTGSSNDPYKSDNQKKILKNFLTKNRLKK